MYKKIIFLTIIGLLVTILYNETKRELAPTKEINEIAQLKKTTKDALLAHQRSTMLEEQYNMPTILNQFNIQHNPFCDFSPENMEALLNLQATERDETITFLSECAHIIFSRPNQIEDKYVYKALGEISSRKHTNIKPSTLIRLYAVMIRYLDNSSKELQTNKVRKMKIVSLEKKISLLIEEYKNTFVNFKNRETKVFNCDFYWAIAPVMNHSKVYNIYNMELTNLLDYIFNESLKKYKMSSYQTTDIMYCLQASLDRRDLFSSTYQDDITGRITDSILKWNMISTKEHICPNIKGIRSVFEPHSALTKEVCEKWSPNFETNFRAYHFLNKIHGS